MPIGDLKAKWTALREQQPDQAERHRQIGDKGRRMPTIAHIIYIPAILLLGFVAGFVFGGRTARAAQAEVEVREAKKAKRRNHAEVAAPKS